MTNTNDARRAHELVDAIGDGHILSSIDVDFLRSFLPELPKPVTLADLLDRVHDAWIKANPSDWGFDTPAEHHDWLFDLRNDLVRILQEQDTPAAVPALPAGMRLADHEQYGRCVVSPEMDENNEAYRIFYRSEAYITDSFSCYVEPDTLTFIDAEPVKPAHPEFLETEADYQNAPNGTIVVSDGGVPCHKFQSKWSSVAFLAMKDDRGMSRACRRVLRWGK